MSLAQVWKAKPAGCWSSGETVLSWGPQGPHHMKHMTSSQIPDHVPPPRAHPRAHPATASTSPCSAGTNLGIRRPRRRRSGRDTGGWLQQCTSGHQTLPDRGTALCTVGRGRP